MSTLTSITDITNANVLRRIAKSVKREVTNDEIALANDKLAYIDEVCKSQSSNGAMFVKIPISYFHSGPVPPDIREYMGITERSFSNRITLTVLNDHQIENVTNIIYTQLLLNEYGLFVEFPNILVSWK